jgi:site-specific DNA-cytosine methylase
MADELANWREQLTITRAKHLCRHSENDKYSVAVLASGGLLDTLAAIRAGLLPIWGSDNNQVMRRLWTDLVGMQCNGDAFQLDLDTLRRPKVLKTGFPCLDYTSLGHKQGTNGDTGYMYVEQARLILRLSPDVAIIEQTDGVLEIDDGRAARDLITRLTEQYYVHYQTVEVWRYGDVSSRRRFIIIAAHRRLGEAAKQYTFPTPVYNDNRHPIAADIAVADSEVTEEYLLEGEPVEMYEWKEPEPGRIHHLGNYGEGPGNCDWPHPLQSWWGLANTQLTSNGGARRVRLDWQPGQAIRQTRLTTPIETVRIASLSETYLHWIRQIVDNDDSLRHTIDSDILLRQCVNNGVPLRTSMAIDESVIRLLQAAGVKPDIPATADTTVTVDAAQLIWDIQQHEENDRTFIRSMLVDTGASGSLNYVDIERALQQVRQSNHQIAVANNTSMPGSMDGQLSVHVLNTAGYKGVPITTPFTFQTTTVEQLRTELLSMDEPYRHGKWNLLLRQPDYDTE